MIPLIRPIPYHIESLGLKNFGWFNLVDAEDLSMTLPVGLYGFAACEIKPHNSLYAWEVQETLDIGLGGGGVNLFRIDDKNGTGHTGTQKTNFGDRVQIHSIRMTTDNPTQLNKCNETELIINQYVRDTGFQVWVNILAPDFTTDPEILRQYRASITLCEAEAIWMYEQRWGDVPFGNPGHCSNVSKRQMNSVSSKWAAQPTLVEFFKEK